MKRAKEEFNEYERKDIQHQEGMKHLKEQVRVCCAQMKGVHRPVTRHGACFLGDTIAFSRPLAHLKNLVCKEERFSLSLLAGDECVKACSQGTGRMLEKSTL